MSNFQTDLAWLRDRFFVARNGGNVGKRGLKLSRAEMYRLKEEFERRPGATVKEHGADGKWLSAIDGQEFWQLERDADYVAQPAGFRIVYYLQGQLLQTTLRETIQVPSVNGAQLAKIGVESDAELERVRFQVERDLETEVLQLYLRR